MLIKSNPALQAEVDTLVECLSALSIGETLTYAAATDAIHRDAAGVARFSLLKAREQVEKLNGARFGTVHKVGVQRLATSDIPAIGSQARRRARRIARKAYGRLSGLAVNDFTTDERTRVDAERSLLGAVEVLMQEPARKKAEQAVTRAGSVVPVGETLAMFTK